MCSTLACRQVSKGNDVTRDQIGGFSDSFRTHWAKCWTALLLVLVGSQIAAQPDLLPAHRVYRPSQSPSRTLDASQILQNRFPGFWFEHMESGPLVGTK